MNRRNKTSGDLGVTPSVLKGQLVGLGFDARHGEPWLMVLRPGASNPELFYSLDADFLEELIQYFKGFHEFERIWDHLLKPLGPITELANQVYTGNGSGFEPDANVDLEWIGWIRLDIVLRIAAATGTLRMPTLKGSALPDGQVCELSLVRA